MIELLSNVLRPYTFKGKARLLHGLCPRSGEENAEVFGYRIKLDRSDYIQRSMYLGTFEPLESCLVKEYLKPGMTFVDVGANVGYYTLLAASLVGSEGLVIAFEPSPYAYGRLTETIAKNRMPNVRTIRAGLGDRTCELQLFISTKPGNHTPTMVPDAGGAPLSVPVFTLDEYLKENEIDRVDLMKIDVEGFEPNVIKGATDSLKRGKIRAILCEFNAHWLAANQSSFASLYDLLTAAGFVARSGKPDTQCTL